MRRRSATTTRTSRLIQTVRDHPVASASIAGAAIAGAVLLGRARGKARRAAKAKDSATGAPKTTRTRAKRATAAKP